MCKYYNVSGFQMSAQSPKHWRGGTQACLLNIYIYIYTYIYIYIRVHAPRPPPCLMRVAGWQAIGWQRALHSHLHPGWLEYLKHV